MMQEWLDELKLGFIMEHGGVPVGSKNVVQFLDYENIDGQYILFRGSECYPLEQLMDISEAFEFEQNKLKQYQVIERKLESLMAFGAVDMSTRIVYQNFYEFWFDPDKRTYFVKTTDEQIFDIRDLLTIEYVYNQEKSN